MKKDDKKYTIIALVAISLIMLIIGILILLGFNKTNHDNTDINFFIREGHNLGELKFTSKAIDTTIYNHMLMFSVNNKMTVVSFNCSKNQYNEWMEVGEFIIKSIKFE